MIVLVCLPAPAPSRAGCAALDLGCTLAGNAEVVTITAGGPPNSESLVGASTRASVARALHIDGPALATADFMTLGMVLAEAARQLGAQLIITGERSDDEGQGLVPAALAYHLRANLISRVQAVRMSPQADTVEVTARAGGQICTIACPLPVVLATSPGRRGAAHPLAATALVREAMTLAQLGIDPSRLVPRPDLLGTLLPAPIEEVRELTFEQAAEHVLRHH